MKPSILYVDDDVPNLDVFRRTFDEEFDVRTAESGPAALQILERDPVGLVISDQRMDPMTGLELLARVEERWPMVGRMLLTAYSDRELLLAAIQRGRLHDFVLKPWSSEDLGLRLRHALDAYVKRAETARAVTERDALKGEKAQRWAADDIIGLESGLREVAAKVDKIAPTDSTVLILGESGTGKELFARRLHSNSARQDGPFVRVNCAAFAEGLLESELFGHEAKAFTGARADKAKQGRFEQADGGTIFLDEIGDIDPKVQVRLLRVIQEREIERVGGERTIKVDFRLIAATHRPLIEMVRAGQFREDLYHRLSVSQLRLPPLRERPEDVAALARHFTGHFGREYGKRLSLTEGAIAALKRYDWPGNVRELRNVIERAAVLAEQVGALHEADLAFDFASPPAPAPAFTPGAPQVPNPVLPSAAAPAPDSVFDEVHQRKKAQIEEAIRQGDGSITKAAKILGVARTTLNDWLRKYGVRP